MFFFLVNLLTIVFSIQALKSSNSIFILFSKIRGEQISFYRNYFRDINSQLKSSDKNKIIEVIDSASKTIKKVAESKLHQLIK